MAVSDWLKKGKNALFRSDGSVTSKLIGEIRDTDTFLCSYPKSGNTWLRFIIANGLSNEEISLISVNKHVPDIYNFSKEIKSAEGPRYIKTHHPEFSHFPSCICITRDYRDVLVSYYHYLKGHGNNISWDHFINSSELLSRPFGYWYQHVALAKKHQAEHPKQILVLRYEDLLDNSKELIKSIFNYLNITPIKPIEQIDALCRFDTLVDNEKKNGKLSKSPDFTFFRQGDKKQWESYMSDTEWRTYLNDKEKHAMESLGYAL